MEAAAELTASNRSRDTLLSILNVVGDASTGNAKVRQGMRMEIGN